jgi:hypothetical protein
MKTPMLRSDLRRDIDPANNLENSSRRSMVDTFYLSSSMSVVVSN